MFPGRLALATVVETSDRRTQNTDGSQTCDVFTAKLKIFEKFATSSPSTASLNEITLQEFEVINTNAAPVLVGEQIVVAQGPDERWFTLERPHPKFQFVTLGKIANRAVQVKVLRTMHAPPNLDDPGRILEYGDTVTIYDPFNLWSDIETDATGWAYLAYAQPEHVVRYEIEECSLPVNEINAKLKDCLMGGMTTGVALVDMGDTAIRSAYPNVDHPPEVPFPYPGAETQQVEVIFQNTFHLDGVGDSKCVLRRVTNLLVSDPENFTAPTPRSSTTAQWELISVAKKIARHIDVTFDINEGDWVPSEDGFYDGYDPRETGDNCDITILCPQCVCYNVRTDLGDEGYAFLDTTASAITYYVYTTKSAFYGKPVRHKVLADVTQGGEAGPEQPLLRFDGGNCEIDYKVVNADLFCPDDPVETSMTIPTTETQVAICEGGSFDIKQCASNCLWEYHDTPVAGWTRIIPCQDAYNLGCDCGEPIVENPTEGQTEYTDCTGEYPPQLCLTLGTSNVRHIDCGTTTTSSPCEVACIDLDESGTGHECPDPCEVTTPAP